MEENKLPSKRQLPKLEDLNHDIEAAFKNDGLNLLLNREVPAAWVKDHPFARNVKYLPIEKVEFLLTRIFQEWRVEILNEGQLFQSIYVKVRLHYKNPVNGEWSFHDGVGAVDVQTEKGASPADLAKIVNGAVMKGLPAAKSYAIKDAAEHLGKLFGRDLNRKDVIEFTPAYAKETMWTKKPETVNGTAH